MEDELEEAFFRLLTEDIGNESSVTFRNSIGEELAKHLAHQLTRIAIEVMNEHDGRHGL